MIGFVCTPLPVRIAQQVAMVTMHFNIVQMSLFFRNIFFSFREAQEIFWAPMKKCHGVQGRSN